MNAQEIIAKADRGEGLTEEEIRVYREAVKRLSSIPTASTERSPRSIWKRRMSESSGRLKTFPNTYTA